MWTALHQRGAFVRNSWSSFIEKYRGRRSRGFSGLEGRFLFNKKMEKPSHLCKHLDITGIKSSIYCLWEREIFWGTYFRLQQTQKHVTGRHWKESKKLILHSRRLQLIVLETLWQYLLLAVATVIPGTIDTKAVQAVLCLAPFDSCDRLLRNNCLRTCSM